ncbi:hypothetical protein GE061_013026 [Apolygus lucorum]|uniref:5'-nucleotidase n=1 Tax=Apolygus lucorum TaxID=248454 RepID=A0A6A4JT05_APOLU|nr:hypothetical protein GE061_013026 [Apolygus lucorum]
MDRLNCVCVLLAVVRTLAGFELNILHINDAHAHIDGTSRSSGLCRASSSCYGGFARVVAKVKELKAKEKNTLWLSAGDVFQGSPYFSKFKSDVLVPFVNEMGFDAQSLGNHEFDEGVPELAKYLKQVTSPVLCCNIDLSEEPSLKAKVLSDSKILEVGGTKVGIVGYLTTDILPENTGKVKILPEVPSLRRAAAEVRKQGAQVVIALGHSGYEPELEIAKQVEELDAVIGGHSHTFLYTGDKLDGMDKPKGPYPTMVTQSSGKKVPVVQAFQFTKYLGHLRLEFDSKFRLVNSTGAPILLKPNFPRDKNILAMQEKWDQNMTEVCQVVGEFKKDMEGDRTVCRFQECPMGNFAADALLDYAYKNVNESNIIAFLHGGLIRSSIEKGKATVAEVSSVLPFKDNTVVLKVPGAKLLEALEFSVKDYSLIVGTPRFLQTSGLKVKFDLKKPPGSRVNSAVIVGRSGGTTNILRKDSYNVVMSKFTYNGGDGYEFFKKESVILHESKGPIDGILLEYLRNRGPYEPPGGKRVELES